MKSHIEARGISFSAEMVKAILKGWKKQTSRLHGLGRFNPGPQESNGYEIEYFVEEEPGRWLAISNDESGEFPPGVDPWVKCPYGQVGDHLWVGEPWRVGMITPWNSISIEYRADAKQIIHSDFSAALFAMLGSQCRADCRKKGVTPWLDGSVFRKRKAFSMPRAFSRILLKITDIKIAKLKAITREEVIEEGIEQVFCDEETSCIGWKNYRDPSSMCCRSRDSFFSLWDSIYGPGAAEKNPWVWMIKFDVVEIKK